MSKYRNRKTEVDNILFDSKAEARRYEELRSLQSGGVITNLEMQVRYPIAVNGVKVCTYIADFVYRDALTGETTVEDVKGMVTHVYRLKSKLMKACHGISVKEVAA